jgi:hypothetical protein
MILPMKLSIRLLAVMSGLKIEFINGYTWSGLKEQYGKGAVDLLHPVVRSKENLGLGLFSNPLITLPRAVVTRSRTEPITSLSQIEGKTLAIPVQ